MSALPDLDMGGIAPFDDTPTAELSPRAPLFATTRNIQVEPAPGSVLRSRYVLEDVIGYGGTSIVFRARDRHRALSEDEGTNVVAVKLLRPEKRDDPLALRRLKREFWQMQRLSHPCIVRVFDLDCDGDVWFITMELVSGRTVRSWMDTGGSVADALKIIGACCEALEYAHCLGIVHGDVKPTNVMVANDGAAKLIDFGSASSAGRCAPAIPDCTFAATPSYASPQILAGERADRRDDVFSVARLSYVIFGGARHPLGGRPAIEHGGTTPAPDVMPAHTVELFEVIERGLSAERAQRPASAREFLRNLTDADRRGQVDASSRASSLASSPTTPVCDDVPAGRDSAWVMQTAKRAWRRMSHGITVMMAAGAESLPRLRRMAAASWVLQLIGRRIGRDDDSSRPAQSLVSWIVAVVLAIIGAAILFGRHTHQVAVHPTTAAAKLSVSSSHGAVVQAISNQSLLYISVPRPPALWDREFSGTAEVLPVAESAPDQITMAAAPSGVVAETKVRPHDFGVISFEAPTVHASARQPLVAIGVVRRNGTKSGGAFVWRVDRGPSQPGVDDQSTKPQLVRFIEGQAVRMLFIPLNDPSEDGLASGPRDFTVELRQVAGGPTLGRYSRITVVIDPPPS